MLLCYLFFLLDQKEPKNQACVRFVKNNFYLSKPQKLEFANFKFENSSDSLRLLTTNFIIFLTQILQGRFFFYFILK